MSDGADAEPRTSGDFDLVALGETMVSFISTDEPGRYRAIAAGAESNVAIDMARLGCRTAWVSRLGDDPLGRLVEDSVAAAGVGTWVERDEDRPTGVMVKHPAGAEKVSSYYRSQSAARALSPADLARAPAARWMHLTGITPALSTSARELVVAAMSRRSSAGRRLSFDINYRPSLWADAGEAADVLVPLARVADVVFIGEDEADALIGDASESRLAASLLGGTDRELVLKRGPGEASAITGDGTTSVAAMPTDVIDVTGAGDAFAAGYLAALCFDWPVETRLRLGHWMAAQVVRSTDDTVPELAPEILLEVSPEGLAASWENR